MRGSEGGKEKETVREGQEIGRQGEKERKRKRDRMRDKERE